MSETVEKDPYSLLQRLEVIRGELKYSKAKMAELMGVKAPTYGDYISKPSIPGTDKVVSLVLNENKINLSYLLFGDGEPLRDLSTNKKVDFEEEIRKMARFAIASSDDALDEAMSNLGNKISEIEKNILSKLEEIKKNQSV